MKRTLICAIPILIGVTCAMSDLQLNQAMLDRGLTSRGDPARLAAAFARAAEGKPIVVGVIGGSITAGAAAGTEGNRYGNLVADWWRKTFPEAQVSFVNAGIGATGSDIGSHRVTQDLVAKNPDFVVVEFGVNDPPDEFHARTYEGLVRQLLVAPKQPALVLLFTMNKNGQNSQEWQTKIGTHYVLPMVSYRDAVWPEIEAGRLTWEDTSPDEVHPNDAGHRVCAELIGALLDQVRAGLGDAVPVPIAALPAPLLTDEFVHTELLTADSLEPTRNDGWEVTQPGAFGRGWQTEKPGSVIEFRVRGSTIGVIFWRVKGAMGRVRAQVDDRDPVVLEGWFGATWGGYTPYQVVASGLDPGEHTLRLTLLDEKHPESTGTQFQVRAIAAAGLPPVP